MGPISARVTLHTLNNSDGSALYVSLNGTHTMQSAVHYPLEVPYRSDEIPTDTHIEVSLRPHNGVAMVKERHVEATVRRVLRGVVLGEETPRCMLQITIQVMEVEADEDLPGGVKGGGQGEGYLDILVGAVNASMLGCLDGGVQMKGLVGAILVGITQDQSVVISPNVTTRKMCRSLHALGFSSKGRCVLIESVGSFDLEELEAAEKEARAHVCGAQAGVNETNGDVQMVETDASPSLFEVMRRSVAERVARDKR